MSEDNTPLETPSPLGQPEKKNGCSPGCFWVLVAVLFFLLLFLTMGLWGPLLIEHIIKDLK